MDPLPSGDTVLADLQARIPRLVKETLADDEVKVATATRLRETLESEANENAESILQSTNREITEVRNAREALAAHEGRLPGGLSPRDISSALLRAHLSFACSAIYLIFILIILLARHSSIEAFIVVILGAITCGAAMWGAASRLVALRNPDMGSGSEIFWAGVSCVLYFLPDAIVAIYIAHNRGWIFRNLPAGLGIVSAIALTGIGLQVAVALWIPRTKHFVAGSRLRRQVMKQLGASTLMFTTANILQDAMPTILPSYVYLVRGQRALRKMASGRKPLIFRSSSHPWFVQRRRLEALLANAIMEWEQSAVRNGILPFLRTRINEISTPAFSLDLNVFDTSGLSQMSAQEYVVTTPAFARQRRAIDPLDGGIIGIAGPRGAGKTTILQAYQAGRFLSVGEEQMVVFESVPVAYDARDFILHLYYQVCSTVADFVDRHLPSAAARQRNRSHPRRRKATTLLLVLLVTWAPVVWYSAKLHSDPHYNLPAWVTRAGWLIGLAIGASVVLSVYLWKGRRRAQPSDLHDRDATDLHSLRELATRRMMDIRFQQSHTYGWAGKLGMPVPYSAEISHSHDLEISAKSRTYPEIVSDFQNFLSKTVIVVRSVPNLSKVPIVIILDELDKISSIQSVREFINEAKGFVRMQSPGVLCLISVSEDALAFFAERGLPARDALDSTFDAVIDIGYLSLADSIHLLNRRVIGMSLPFICLCHCLAGGLPRELVRIARELTEATASTLIQICHEMVITDLRGKLRSWLGTIANSDARYARKAVLIGYLNDSILGEVTAHALLAAAANSSAPSVSKADAEQASLDEIEYQISAYLYFMATILEVFTMNLTQELVERACGPDGPGSFDALSRARQQFAVSPCLSWLTLNAFREAWQLSLIDSPEP